jgi:tetratricopeptide (TPR) repeat protein
LPETPYERLVGRNPVLEFLDRAWADKKTNILSLVAEGGAGKSALINEWLTRMRADNYRGASLVLGWSFYSQGTKERATSADEFLDWVLDRLDSKITTTSAVVKGETIAEALMHRRVLILMDGVEPLQHGPDGQKGLLKDQGMRALLRRFASAPTSSKHGLILLTSRLAVKDIDRWKDTSAPVLEIDRLSSEAGAGLLRDNGIWGTDHELERAVQDFGGHALALGLLASFLKETQKGDIRRRDHIRAFMADRENPRHDHAVRVMESYENEWLSEKPLLLDIMHLLGLFDRPASGDCLLALRKRPAIAGLTDRMIQSDDQWERAIARLREVRLILPLDPIAPQSLDSHPIVREWFGASLKARHPEAWKAAHGRLYQYLCDSTEEGEKPSLADLSPLYQAIAHGCRAGRYQEAIVDVYQRRICKRRNDGDLAFYALRMLGSIGADLAALSWFFEAPFVRPVSGLSSNVRRWVLGVAAECLRAQGRLWEALPSMRAALDLYQEADALSNAAAQASNLCASELLVGDVAQAISVGRAAVELADRSGNGFQSIITRTALAEALLAAGKNDEAMRLMADAELLQKKRQPKFPLLYSVQGYRYCELLLDKADFAAASTRATTLLQGEDISDPRLDRALNRLAFGRAKLGLLLSHIPSAISVAAAASRARQDEAVEGLRASSNLDDLPRALLARAALHRTAGIWQSAAHDLEEVEEIAEPQMRLFLCDLALERARLFFAQAEAFAPLSFAFKDAQNTPSTPGDQARAKLHADAAIELALAKKLVADCGYHRRDTELAELQAVLRGERTFASLPIHV